MHFLVLLTALVACAAGEPVGARIPRPEGRIAGGTQTRIEAHPYQVSLRNNGNHICGGSIINPTSVVTAARCVKGLNPYSLTVVAGSTYLNSGGKFHSVNGGYIHGDYDSNTDDYDVAVLQVSPPFSYSDSVQNITLEDSDVPVDTSLVVTGWGASLEGGSNSDTLIEATVRTVSDTTCILRYGRDITARMICAGGNYEGRNFCQGDNGGPLAALWPRRLVGIASWERNCDYYYYPGVYTKVSAVRDWILHYSRVQQRLVKFAIGPAIP